MRFQLLRQGSDDLTSSECASAVQENAIASEGGDRGEQSRQDSSHNGSVGSHSHAFLSAVSMTGGDVLELAICSQRRETARAIQNLLIERIVRQRIRGNIRHALAHSHILVG